MDRYEATKVVFSRIQSLDPENASKIMGLLLIQDHADKEMIRLAFGPESLLHTVVLKARQELGISPNNNNNTISTPSSPYPPTTTTPSSAATNNPHPHPRQTSRLFLPNGFKIPSTLSVPSLASPSSVSSPSPSPSPSPSWGTSVFSSSEDLVSPVGNGIGSGNVNLPSSNELIDEIQLQDQLSFLNDPAEFPNYPTAGWAPNHQHHHRRSCSVSDINALEGPLGWKPCLYYARGYCKNGTSCRFVHHHGGVGGGFVVGDPDSVLVGSPTSKADAVELLRSKSLQHQKLLAAYHYLTANGGSGSLSPYSGSKTSSLNFLAQQQQQQQSESQRSAAAAMLMGEDMHKLARSRLNNRADYLMSYGGGDSNPASRQIYLTFPADSTFREEDVSNYFSIYGPVQDVRIPYQQKRMFGFVTFLYPETVKIILAKGNPHFVCDARVLVKPYKEKGKVPDKFRKQQLQQQLERGDFSVCTSPTGLDSRDPFDPQLGARMMYSTSQDLRRKLEEQVDLQQALDLQSRRLLGLSLDLKRSHHHRALSTGAAPFPSPTSYSSGFNQPPQFSSSSSSSDPSSPDACQENDSVAVLDNNKALQVQIGSNNVNDMGNKGGGSVIKGSRNCNGKESTPLSHIEDDNTNLPESLDHNLPDSPFASPTKGCGGDRMATFSSLGSSHDGTNGVASMASSFGGTNNSSNNSNSNNNNNNNILAPSSLFPGSPPPTLDMAPFSSCYFQMPRFASGHGAIGM